MNKARTGTSPVQAQREGLIVVDIFPQAVCSFPHQTQLGCVTHQ